MQIHPIVRQAAETLCARFDANEYNPTPLIDLGALVASADGTVDPGEIEALSEIFQQLLGTEIKPELMGHLLDASVEVIRAAGVPARARLLAEILAECEAVEEGLTVALAVAFASEGLAAPERAVIARIASAAGMPAQQFDALVDRLRGMLETG